MIDPRPILAITMGDPAGIGPEITLKALHHADIFNDAIPLVIGHAPIFQSAINTLHSPLKLHIITSPSQAIGTPGTLDLLDLPNPPTFSLGQVSATAGEAAFQSILAAIELAMKSQVHAVVTNPLNKESLHRAGHNFPGHTEIFAHYTGARHSVMMLAHGNFRVAHVSTHVALKDAIARCTQDRVLRTIELAAHACRDLGIPNPRVGVAGLNPHAGEHGLFGDEEQRAILPAINAAQQKGIHASGPFPADTFFPRASAAASGGPSDFDICIAQYHDQGHLAVKIKGFTFNPATRQWSSVSGINVTLGLPIIRVSVDHGTAFDIAGTGIASEASLLDALAYAARAGKQRMLQPQQNP